MCASCWEMRKRRRRRRSRPWLLTSERPSLSSTASTCLPPQGGSCPGAPKPRHLGIAHNPCMPWPHGWAKFLNIWIRERLLSVAQWWEYPGCSSASCGLLLISLSLGVHLMSQSLSLHPGKMKIMFSQPIMMSSCRSTEIIWEGPEVPGEPRTGKRISLRMPQPCTPS